MMVKLITEAEDIYVHIDDTAEFPEVIIYGKSAFVWSNVAKGYMEKYTIVIDKDAER